MRPKGAARKRFSKQLSAEAWNKLYDSFSSIESDSKWKGKTKRDFYLKINTSSPEMFISALEYYLSGHYKSVENKGSKGYVRIGFGSGSKNDNRPSSPHKMCDEMWSFLANIKKKGRIEDASNTVESKTSNGYIVTTEKSIDDLLAEASNERLTESGDSSISNTTIYIIAAMAFIAVAIIILK